MTFVRIGWPGNYDINFRIRQLNAIFVTFEVECLYAAGDAGSKPTEQLLLDAWFEQRPNPQDQFLVTKAERVKAALLLAALEDITPRTNDTTPDAADS